ncbi:hypothetical protein CSW58_01165 [Caulobacter sp. B11]|uniref:hypothetical protein n=1 Tax=Caulobacter sp. B11 TaxID=2048899 RepID=UPI000C1326F7|nr:hypothetical protein [Caulobacter sp. B11]PHY14157.1 hypothetical protein CSW58_01165 [Caulobacter sp. B11]
METATTRRALFGGAVAVAVAAPAVVQAKSGADAHLVKLEAELKAVERHAATADRRELAAYRRFRAMSPEVPEGMKHKAGDWACGLGFDKVYSDEARVREIRDRHAAVFAAVGVNRLFVERCDEILSAMVPHRAAVALANRTSGHEEAVATTEALDRERDRVLDAIRDAAATTPVGLAIKARVAAPFIDDAEVLSPYGTRWAQAILNDIRAMESV